MNRIGPMACLCAASGLCAAASSAEGRFEVSPSLTVSETRDDNLFSSPRDREEDWITRFRPGLGTSYRTAAFRAEARYALDAEHFRDHADLTTAVARQDVHMEMEAALGRTWTLALRQQYLDTGVPAELSPLAGLDLGRASAHRLVSGGFVTHRLGPRTNATVAYVRTADALAEIRGVTHEASLGLERRWSARDALGLEYAVQLLEFPQDRELLHGLTLGWTRDLAGHTSLRLAAGPAVSAESTSAEAEASLRHRFRRGEMTLVASQSRSRVVGQAGAAVVRGASARVALEPASWLSLGLAPGVVRIRLDGSQVTTWRGSLDLTCRLARWLSLSAAHDWTRQQGLLGLGGDAVVRHGATTFALVLAPPERRRSAEEPARGAVRHGTKEDEAEEATEP